MMDAADFQNLLDRLGDDLSRWPEEVRRDAELLLRDSEPARAALADAQRLRRLMSSPPVTAPDGLVNRIMARVRRDPGNPAAPADASPPREDDRDSN